jgi:hypothetical protein
LPVGPERVDDPDVLVKYLSWFHGCKDSAKRTNEQMFYRFFYCNGATAHRRTITIIDIYDRNGVYVFLYYIYIIYIIIYIIYI